MSTKRPASPSSALTPARKKRKAEEEKQAKAPLTAREVRISERRDVVSALLIDRYGPECGSQPGFDAVVRVWGHVLKQQLLHGWDGQESTYHKQLEEIKKQIINHMPVDFDFPHQRNSKTHVSINKLAKRDRERAHNIRRLVDVSKYQQGYRVTIVGRGGAVVHPVYEASEIQAAIVEAEENWKKQKQEEEDEPNMIENLN